MRPAQLNAKVYLRPSSKCRGMKEQALNLGNAASGPEKTGANHAQIFQTSQAVPKSKESHVTQSSYHEFWICEDPILPPAESNVLMRIGIFMYSALMHLLTSKNPSRAGDPLAGERDQRAAAGAAESHLGIKKRDKTCNFKKDPSLSVSVFVPFLLSFGL